MVPARILRLEFLYSFLPPPLLSLSLPGLKTETRVLCILGVRFNFEVYPCLGHAIVAQEGVTYYVACAGFKLSSCLCLLDSGIIVHTTHARSQTALSYEF